MAEAEIAEAVAEVAEGIVGVDPEAAVVRAIVGLVAVVEIAAIANKQQV
jgi:hypothetical protein